MSFALSLSLLALLIWLNLLLLRGFFWRSTPELDGVAAAASASVCVVIPARDEAASIAAALESLLAQQYAGSLSILLVDDNSVDGTGEIAAAIAARDARLTILHGAPLAAGWSGKLWAVHQGLQKAFAQRPDYILLTDADIVHAPDHLAQLVAHAESHQLDLTSEMAQLNCATSAERAFIPAFIYFFQMLYPFAWVASARHQMAGAAGGVMLLKTTALEGVEGVTRIRRNLIDDCALAAEIKGSGGRIWLGHACGARSLRVYADWREIWDMVARTAYVQLKHSPLMLCGCVAGMFLVYCAPPLLALVAASTARLCAALAWLIMAASFQPTLRRYRRSPAWGLALPLIALFYMGATLASAWRHHRGRGGGWKNRTYAQ